MKFLEKDLEEIIFNTPNDLLRDRDLMIYGVKKRQLRIGNYGILDIVSVDKEYNQDTMDTEPFLVFNIIEIKKDKIGISAFFQAIRYIKGIKRYLTVHKPTLRYTFELTLIGSSLDDKGSFCFIPDLIKGDGSDSDECIRHISFYTYTYELDGLIFESKSYYKLTNEGF